MDKHTYKSWYGIDHYDNTEVYHTLFCPSDDNTPGTAIDWAVKIGGEVVPYAQDDPTMPDPDESFAGELGGSIEIDLSRGEIFIRERIKRYA